MSKERIIAEMNKARKKRKQCLTAGICVMVIFFSYLIVQSLRPTLPIFVGSMVIVCLIGMISLGIRVWKYEKEYKKWKSKL